MTGKRCSYRNAALVAFAVQLLEFSSSTSSTTVRTCRIGSRRSTAAAFSRCAAASSCFVHVDGYAKTSAYMRKRRVSALPTAGKNSHRHLAVLSSQARISKRAGSSAVAPRFYVDSSSSSSLEGSSELELEEQISNDALVHLRDATKNGEFSKLSSYFAFTEMVTEMDLQELFMNRAGATSSAMAGRSTLEEDEIGHRQAHESEHKVSPSPANMNGVDAAPEQKETVSPFYFASFPAEESRMSSQLRSKEIKRGVEPQTLPPWLALDQSLFAPEKLSKLRQDLRPHLSSKEITEVVVAIHQSSQGDMKKMAGASDLCSILVNSLEITGVHTLCAAAFHYASLVSVRERELNTACCADCAGKAPEERCLETAGSEAKYLCALAGSGIEAFGTHAAKIALDSAKLKSMETMAAAVLRTKNGKLGKLGKEDAKNLRSLLLGVSGKGDWRALAIRSAACLYRLKGLEGYQHSLSEDANKSSSTTRLSVTAEELRSSQEALHIYAPIAARLGMFRLKYELEDAAFRTLYPRSHAAVSSMCGGDDIIAEGMRSVLSDVTLDMKRLIQEDCSFMENIDHVSVTARVKEPYSVWRKMLKISRESEGKKSVRGMSILDVPDAIATRVVLSARKLSSDETSETTARRERELCYYLLDLCAEVWPEMPDSTFKDYVESPKPNGYRSLHYSTRKRWRGSSWPFEVQLRSSEMHRVAEYGVAAHWNYKRQDMDGTTNRHALSASPHLDRTSKAYFKSVEERRKKQASHSYPDSNDDDEPALYIEDEIRRQRKRDRAESLAPYLEALSGDMSDMTRENVFIFVNVQPPTGTNGEGEAEGTVLSLPHGSRVLDAIRATERWSNTLEADRGCLYDGRSFFVAFRNGLRTSSMGSEHLANGDIISILPS